VYVYEADEMVLKTRVTKPIPSFAPNTNKCYILRQCINIVFILLKTTLIHRR